MSEAEKGHRKVYAKGFYDGVRAMGGENTMSMSAARFQGELNGLSSIARKVYDATPASEEWGSGRILIELKRVGVAADSAKVDGCLAGLVRSGLVKEPKRGSFIRADVKPPKPVLVASQSMPAPVAMTEEMPVDEFAMIAQQVRGIAKMLSDAATEIENAALKVSDRIAASSGDLDKLKQLQKLLNELRS